jgi:predicted N-acyltransferase
MVSFKIYRSISEIEPEAWDSVNTDNDYLKSYSFLRIIEESDIESSKFWYFLFFNENQIVGATVLSAFNVALELFLDDTSKSLVYKIRKVFPGFMNVTFLFCGIPISVGKETLLIKDTRFTEPIIKTLIKEMRRIGIENKISILNFKEYFLDHKYEMKFVTENGFLKSWTLPYMRLKIAWSSFEEYLHSMRHTFRRQVLNQMVKTDFSIFGIRQEGLLPDCAKIVYGNRGNFNPNLFFSLYSKVMDHAEVVLERLNPRFFEKFIKDNEKVEIISIIKDDAILGSAILVKEDKKLIFLLVGFNYEFRDKYGVYFNLIYGIIAYAIENKYEILDMGQTSNYAKARVGGVGIPMVTYVCSPKKFLFFLLKVFNRVIFPETRLKVYNVFKAES